MEKMDIKTEMEVKKIAADLEKKDFIVSELKEREVQKNPLAPLNTSLLQQEANKKFGFSAKQTMKIAQELYEGVNIANKNIGLITYMRTDSCSLSEKFTAQVKNWIIANLGREYAEEVPRVFKTKTRSAQEAHEAIRPTSANRAPQEIKSFLNKNQYRLYDLIWKRAVACQAKSARVRQMQATIKAGGGLFKSNGNTVVFDGFLKILGVDSKDVILPELKEGERLELEELKPEQHFTEPPPRYGDAALVKALEEYGIGRPST